LEAIATMMPPTGSSRATATKAPARQGICSRSVFLVARLYRRAYKPRIPRREPQDGSGSDRVQSPPAFGGDPTTCIDEH
jgi:hypothetical protein